VPRLTEQRKRALATDAATLPVSVLADRYNYSIGGMAQLLKSDDMQPYLDAAQLRVESVSSRLFAKLAFAGDTAVQNIIDASTSSDPDDQPLFHSRWIAEKLLPTRGNPDADQSASIFHNTQTINVLVDAKQTFLDLAARKAETTPELPASANEGPPETASFARFLVSPGEALGATLNIEPEPTSESASEGGPEGASSSSVETSETQGARRDDSESFSEPSK
jgi:hypothetical protein